MDMRHPVRSLTWALMQALDQDLMGIESTLANQLIGNGATAPITCRPRIEDCGVVMFTQSWLAAELGFNDRHASAPIDAETVIVTGPGADACVYVSTQLLYKVEHPNRRFFLDVAAQRMRGKSEHRVYEGRDTVDQEAFDYEAAGALARVRGAAKRLEPAEAARVVRMLKACMDEFEAAASRR